MFSIPPPRTLLPGFIPGSVYVAVMEREIRPDTTSAYTPVVSATTDEMGASVSYLAFFYQEKPTIAPLAMETCVRGQYWCLLPADGSGKLILKHGSMSVQEALIRQDVVGYIRVAKSVDPRSLQAIIQRDDYRIDSLSPMSSEIYVFNAMDRLRRNGILHAVIWDLKSFKTEIDRLRKQWKEEAKRIESARKAAAQARAVVAPKRLGRRMEIQEELGPVFRPFADFSLCEFTTREH